MSVGRSELAILSFSKQEMCPGILINLWVNGNILQVSRVGLTNSTTLKTFKVSVTVSTVKDFAKEETCWWRKMDLTLWKRWDIRTDTTFTFTTTGSNDLTDLQIDQWMCLTGMLQARSRTEDLEGLSLSLGKKYLVQCKEH